MRLLGKIVMVGLICAAPGVVRAADVITVPTSDGDAIPVASGGVNWNGFYAGVYGVSQMSPLGGTQFGLGLDVGANAQFQFVLVGAEVAYQGLGGGAGNSSYLQGLGRFGVAVTDDFILYAAGGAGVDFGPLGGTDALIGGGVELAVADDVSLRAQYLHGFALTGANPKDQVTIGANFHF